MADLSSLEDRVIANLSNSKAKKDLIIDGYEGHLYHACMYYREKFITLLDAPTDIEHTKLVLLSMEAKKSGNKEVDKLRQDSKAVTFKLSYGGFPDDHKGGSITQEIFDIYHNDLYPEITDYRENYILTTAKKTGEIHLNLGACLKTNDADKDIRTLNNASVQSFSDITMIAGAQFMDKVHQLNKQNEIKVFNIVYDAIYVEADLRPDTIKWVNDNLIECMAWDDLPELKHPVVKISSAMEVFWPSWANAIAIPKKSSTQEIMTACNEGAEKHLEKHKKETNNAGKRAKTTYL